MAEVTQEDVLATKPDCLAGAAAEGKAETVGKGKAELPIGRMFVLAIMAGLQIGLGALFMTFVKSDAALPFAASQILGGLCFSLGLICVVVAGSELFTGNCLMIMGALSKRYPWAGVFKNWVVVWCGNFVGSLLLVWIIFMCDSASFNSGAVGNAMVSVAYGKMSISWATIFFRGIMCNMLVCLAVWMGFCGRTVIDKIFTCVFPVMAFVALGFEHCVANMFFLPMGVIAYGAYGYTGSALDPAALAQVMDWGHVFYNISAATLGNIVGGCVLVGLIYWFGYRKKSEA